jgi:hypothetical protein
VTPVLKALLEKLDAVHEQVGDFSRDMKIVRKDQMETLEIKITVTEMKNALDGSSMDTT